MQPESNITLEEQLQALEDTFANLLIEGADAQTLAMHWKQIKAIRKQNGSPIDYNSSLEKLQNYEGLNSVQKVMLQFQNAKELRRFQDMIACDSYRIDMPNLILTCDCSKENITQAIKEFGATVISLPFSLL
jgi:hypothetical protein